MTTVDWETLNIPIDLINTVKSLYQNLYKPKLKLKESLPTSTTDETQNVLSDTSKIKINKLPT